MAHAHFLAATSDADGERYENISNIHATWQGCRQSNFALADLMVFSGKLAQEGSAELDPAGFLCGAKTPAPRQLTAADKQLIWRWVRSKMSAPWRQPGHWKCGDLDASKLYQKVKEV